MLLVSHDRQLISQSCNRFWLIDNGELSEWHDLDAVNARIRETSAEITVPKTAVEAKTEISGDSDRLLEQLLDLEQRLADDLARKPKHQKPLLQAQWRKEIERLNAQLE